MTPDDTRPLVERLREGTYRGKSALMDEAADEIERLEQLVLAVQRRFCGERDAAEARAQAAEAEVADAAAIVTQYEEWLTAAKANADREYKRALAAEADRDIWQAHANDLVLMRKVAHDALDRGRHLSPQRSLHMSQGAR